MAARQEDFFFAERILQRGWATDEQVSEGLSLLERLRAEMKLDEALPGLMVKKGYLAPAQANVLEAEYDPKRPGRPKNAIEGYRLLERIGSGAMGSVYKADHLKLQIPVALKVLRPSLATSKTQIERLKREAQLAARLNHPNVVRSLDVGESNGFHYLAMEFVEGKTVRDLLEKGPLPEKEALGIARQVAAGLAHAHAHGVVHRDVKPGNIMLAPDGTAKLADFGLARGQGPSDLTLEHASIGTPQYVAPEQMRRGSDATTRSDLFSLGATLYHMVTGRPPFDGETLGEIVQNVLACTFQPAESLATGLSRDATYVIDRLLRANPRERYATAADLVLDLERIGGGEPIAPADFLGDYQSFLKRRRARRNAIAGVSAAVLLCTGAFLYQRHVAQRKQAELLARCARAAGVRADVGEATTADELRAALAEMTEAEAGAAGCDADSIAPLRQRAALVRVASGRLATAEAAFAAASAADADYCKLHAGLAGLESGLAGVDRRIASIREEIRRLSDVAATARHNRLAFHDAAEVMEEARAFARDLGSRYLALDAPWVEGVLQAPSLIGKFEEEWRRLDVDRAQFDEWLRQGLYSKAATLLRRIRTDEERVRAALFRNAYLARFADVPSPRDERERKLLDQETKEWEDAILPAVTTRMQGPPPRPDEAEELLTAYLARAQSTHAAAAQRLEAATRRREALEREQLLSYASSEALFRNFLRERAWGKAYEDAVAVSASARWLAGPAAKYRALGERAEAVAGLRARFLEGARRQKSVTIRKGVDVAGRDIEPAPGDNPDLFVARRGKEPFEFTLAELELAELERVFAFDDGAAPDQVLRGWFYAAEAIRWESEPYRARDLRRDALRKLRKDDPWVADVQAALDETEVRIVAGEARAAEAAAQLKAAKDAGNQNLKALSLCKELIALKWTKFVEPKLKEYQRDLDNFNRIGSRQLLPLQLGVPESQVTYDDSGNTEIRFTGKLWCPVKEPATAEELERVIRDFWTDWFRSAGKAEKEIEDLVERAKTQRLAWGGDVEVGPKGGYLPGTGARIRDVEKEWFEGAKPQPITLHFPFLPDQPWSIELEVRLPAPQPGYFALSCGQIQAVVGYFKGPFGRGGMKGVCLVESDAMDPGAFTKQLLDLQWHIVEDGKGRRRLTENGEKWYLDEFVEGAPYRMRLERTRESVVFEMWPLGVPRERQAKATVRLEKRFPDARKLDRLVTLADGRTVFRFFGAAGKDLAYELHDVGIRGSLSEKASDVD